MTRAHEEIIASILVNLEMARDVAQARITKAESHCEELLFARECRTYQQAINLIKTEAGLP